MSRKQQSFSSYAEFKNNLMHRGASPFSAEIEELADEMYHVDVEGEIESLWDRAATDDD